MSTAAVSVDAMPIPANAPEELAGPPHLDPGLATRPVTGQERVSTVDTLRGVALLGILAMNIYVVRAAGLGIRDSSEYNRCRCSTGHTRRQIQWLGFCDGC